MKRRGPDGLTRERVLTLLRYERRSGLLRWKITRAGTARAGSIAGNIQGDGYVRIRIDGRKYLAHCLIWFMETGEWLGPNDLDHRNMVKSDNRWNNLRKATRAQNKQNQRVRADSLTGLKGVTPFRGRFQSRINIAGKRLFLGSFATPGAAHRAYC